MKVRRSNREINEVPQAKEPERHSIKREEPAEATSQFFHVLTLHHHGSAKEARRSINRLKRRLRKTNVQCVIY
jgi:hypothetical protein